MPENKCKIAVSNHNWVQQIAKHLYDFVWVLYVLHAWSYMMIASESRSGLFDTENSNKYPDGMMGVVAELNPYGNSAFVSIHVPLWMLEKAEQQRG